MSNDYKIATALRAGRSAAYLSQEKFAEMLGVAKSTIARIETQEMSPKASFVFDALSLLERHGVTVEIKDDVFIKVKGK